MGINTKLFLVVRFISITQIQLIQSLNDTQVAIYSQSTIDMTETCIRFGEHGARVMIEEKEIPHYAMHVDPVKKEVSCWIASEAGKVRGSLFSL